MKKILKISFVAILFFMYCMVLIDGAQAISLSNFGIDSPKNYYASMSYASYESLSDLNDYDWDGDYTERKWQTVYASVESGDRFVWGQASAFSMHGYVNTPGAFGHSLNYFYDELYFESLDGEPASVDLNFDLSFSLNVLDQSEKIEAALGVGLLYISEYGEYSNIVIDQRHLEFYGDNGSFYVKDETDRYLDTGVFLGEGTYLFDEAITLSTDGWADYYDDGPGLVDSGKYFPYAVAIYAISNAGNAVIDFSNSMVINTDNPYGAHRAGDILAFSDYTLTSGQDFQPAVPEPATLFLFGSGLVSAYIVKKKKILS
jgi:hypothetical protein